MTSDGQLPLFGDSPAPTPGPERPPLPDAGARTFATNPANNVVLEASAGTGKTTVLVTRYVNLLRAGVDPSNILAMTFTRQAAAEMRERIIRELRVSAQRSESDRVRWRELRDRLGEISISTIDAFCLSLLREFPLEADLDPAFGMADETEVPRLVEQALDRTLAHGASLAAEDANVAMLLARLGAARVRTGLAHLLGRRLVAPAALQRYLANGPAELTAASALASAGRRLADVLGGVDGGLHRFLADGPEEHPRFLALTRELPQLAELAESSPESLRSLLDRVREYFLTQDGLPRKRFTLGGRYCRSPAGWKRHREAAKALAPAVASALAALDRDLNVVMARGARRLFAIAVSEYERELASRSVLDFSDVLQKALDLLRRMDEFAQSRFRLESRYHHVLVDEFQDTSRAQWELVSLLIQSWGEGFGLVHDAPVPPSVFVVGDRKQSIYGFRDADVAVLRDAGFAIERLRPDGDARRSIAHSFRSAAPLLRFLNDLFSAVEKADRPSDGFCYDDPDRFPVEASDTTSTESDEPALGLVLDTSVEACAERVAGEVVRLLESGTVRDRETGVCRQALPGDIAILFRSRETHREFQAALEQRAVPAFVYKGLGFFDADEIKDYRALLRYLADPTSELRTAALLRSRLVGLSDAGIAALAGQLSESLVAAEPPDDIGRLSDTDQGLLLALRDGVREWLPMADRVPPAELLDQIAAACAYAFELRGPRYVQARENLKKMRGLVRRVQNRGFTTLSRLADHIDRLSGDISNAVVDAFDAVNLMTVHAAKGLEFPVVFLVELNRGTGGIPSPIRVVADGGAGEPSVTVSPYRSEVDADGRLRDREETKRLLYVAATRARDRLYLSATLQDGRLRPAAGSFAGVLPAPLLERFSEPVADPEDRVRWHGPSGLTHDFALVGPASETRRSPTDALSDTDDRFGAWRPSFSPQRVRASGEPTGEGQGEAGAGGVDRVTGRLVHRLLQRDAEAASWSASGTEADEVAVLMSAPERARPDWRELALAAAAIYDRARQRGAFDRLLSGQCLFEVPFSHRQKGQDGSDDRIVRGVIDCLLRSPDGAIFVIEVKTGRPRPEHEDQLARYVDAAGVLFPDASVEGQLLYL